MIWFDYSFIKFCKSFINLIKLFSARTCSSARVRLARTLRMQPAKPARLDPALVLTPAGSSPPILREIRRFPPSSCLPRATRGYPRQRRGDAGLAAGAGRAQVRDPPKRIRVGRVFHLNLSFLDAGPWPPRRRRHTALEGGRARSRSTRPRRAGAWRGVRPRSAQLGLDARPPPTMRRQAAVGRKADAIGRGKSAGRRVRRAHGICIRRPAGPARPPESSSQG